MSVTGPRRWRSQLPKTGFAAPVDADCYQLMIVECYSADVYCDCASHPYGMPGDSNCPDVFTGRGKRETNRNRRKAGWVKISGRDVCPHCKSRKPIKFRDG